MNIQQFFTTYLILIITGSFFVMGFYIITRSDKIFRGWSKLWEKVIYVEKFYYTGEPLLVKYNYLNHVNKLVGAKIEAGIVADAEHPNFDRLCLRVKNGSTITEDDKITIRDYIFCETEVISNEVKFYVDDYVYLFPEWVRFPLSECPPCMASVFGSLFWWGFILSQKDAFLWSESPVFSYFLYWIFFIISLSLINKFLDKKVNY